MGHSSGVQWEVQWDLPGVEREVKDGAGGEGLHREVEYDLSVRV